MANDAKPRRRLALGPDAWLPREGFVVVPVWPPEPMPDATRARSALVGRAGGRLVAYANLCRHLAVPLDFGDGDVHEPGSTDLHCRRHGAVFDARSGECTAGPCLGRSLWPLEVDVDASGDAHLVLSAEPAPPPPPRRVASATPPPAKRAESVAPPASRPNGDDNDPPGGGLAQP